MGVCLHGRSAALTFVGREFRNAHYDEDPTTGYVVQMRQAHGVGAGNVMGFLDHIRELAKALSGIPRINRLIKSPSSPG